jgi:hypothetical protein
MSMLNMLADQSPLAATAFVDPDTVNGAPPSFDTGAAFPSDFLGLSLQDDEPLWGLSPMSPSLPSWNPKSDPAFAGATFERDLKHSQVRNGQPTPPPFDDRKASPSEDLPALGADSWDELSICGDQGRRRRSAGDQPRGDKASAKRRKIRGSKPSTAGSSGAEDDDQRLERVKREKFLERNRLAASKCRQKKKAHTMLLETRYREQSDRKDGLVAEIARLRSEILGLKNEVLKHAQCGDEPIKLHLAQMVKKITYNDAAEFREPTDLPEPAEDGASPSLRGGMSFGFDEPLPLEVGSSAESLEQQIRRDSETAMTFGAENSFDDLLNV